MQINREEDVEFVIATQFTFVVSVTCIYIPLAFSNSSTSGIHCSIQGDNCTIVLHLKCFKTIAKVFFVEKRNWKCKNCTVKSKTTNETTQSDVAVMSHEIQCLNREKQLLIALNDEMKSRNMPLEEKIASSQMYAAKTARPAQGESSSLASGLQVKHSNRILPSAGVVVKTMNASISSNEIFSDIQRNVDLNSLKLELGGVKHIRNGVIIRCENNEAVEKLKVCVHSKLGSKYSVDKMKGFNPRIIVRKAVIANNWSDADIVANMCVLNKLASHDTSNIKIVTKFKFQNSIDIVLEVSPSLRSFFTAQGFMSLISSFYELQLLIEQNSFDIIAITESWLSADIPTCAVNIQSYLFYRQDRLGRSGGVGIYIRLNIRSAVLDITNYTDNLLEYLFIEYKTGQERHCLAVFYRPPKGNVLDAVGHLDQILPQVITQYENITILGDLNINFMVKNNILSHCFESYGLMQVISEPTRITSSTLIDIIFVSNVKKCIAKGTINADTISDHFLVYCKISCDYKNGKIHLFLCDLHAIPWENILMYRDIETKVEFLTKNIIGLLDIHCPTKTAQRNRALQIFRSNKTSSNWNEYIVLHNFALSSLRNEKSAYMRHLHNLSNSSSFYKALKYMQVQVNSKSAEIPKHLRNPHKVNDYFTSTFQNSDLECSDSIFFYRTNKFQENCSFSLTTVDLGSVLNVITNIKSNAGGVDEVTLQMLKLCFPVIGKWILHIINICLERGYFPSCWKVAVVTPLPKVHNPKSLNDLRPISLLPILSKVLEQIVYLQICDYLNGHNIIPVHQSGFQKNLSSTTALAYLGDTIIIAIDKNNMSLLVLLPFDTLNHKLLVAKCCYYGFDDTSCKFIRSYLSGRKQKVVIEDQSSLLNNIKSGVPQGSVLGPLLFLLYTSDIVNQVQYSHLQLFADDTQISHTFSATQYLIAEQNK
nr:unnamed protein product [Callosobruchus analis]